MSSRWVGVVSVHHADLSAPAAAWAARAGPSGRTISSAPFSRAPIQQTPKPRDMTRSGHSRVAGRA
jgi:hypothetical protein